MHNSTILEGISRKGIPYSSLHYLTGPISQIAIFGFDTLTHIIVIHVTNSEEFKICNFHERFEICEIPN